mmetsp:Transcript_32742/g.66895  ORF Transcript_32742/g.66895 Transcript_32742/m.66895 type:complete len:80 (-) Transcript_32742:448-687(-)
MDEVQYSQSLGNTQLRQDMWCCLRYISGLMVIMGCGVADFVHVDGRRHYVLMTSTAAVLLQVANPKRRAASSKVGRSSS